MPLSDEQKAMRMSGIFSSEIAACADLYPPTWKQRGTPEKVIGEKVGDLPPFEGNARTEMGNRYEPVIARWWSEDTGRAITKNETTALHPTISFIGATADYFTDPNELVECKLVSPWVGKLWAELPPVYVQAQVQFQLGVLGMSRGYVAARVEGDSEKLIRSYVIDFNQQAFDQLVSIADRTWRRILEIRATRPQFQKVG